MIVKPHLLIASKVGFASHQNSVPFIKEFSIENLSEEDLSDLTIELSSDLSFIEIKKWKLDQLKAGSSITIRDRDVKLDAKTLMELTESISGEVRLTVTQTTTEQEIEIYSSSYPVELLAKAHWGGTGYMPELLPAFCMPNDPAVDRVLKKASDILRAAGKSDAIKGYEKQSRSRSWELASAIWSAVASLDLSYSLPPASFETNGQKVRTPGSIMEGKLATCLDSTMLFASALEQARLNPLIIITEGHAFVGVWLQPQQFNQLITEEAAAVRKRVELNEIIVFETTLITSSPTPSFSKASEQASSQLSDEEFLMAIDITRARMRGIKPISLPTAHTTEREDAPSIASGPIDLEEAPPLPGFDVEISKTPETADDRVAQWQRKLLDLTARNRLLHLPQRSKQIPLICTDPGALEDLLAAGKTIRIAALPDFEEGGRDEALYEEQNKASLRQQYAAQALDSGEVISELPEKKLNASLVELYRKARSDINEGGANTLFLALGFLNWKKSAEDTRVYRAPLILLPVQLQRKSALSGVTMKVHEDEPRFNLTLLELLKQDFELEIPGLDGDLPEDHSGIDVEGVWNHVRHFVKEIPGFEVTTETALATFSFAKYLMWKDLTDRREQLTNNKVVKHLMERGEEGFDRQAEYPSPDSLDQLVPPSELFTPLPADSSQLAAVVASANGCNFVLDGPPGTGKSQTIANMIVHNLSIGRRVLFVAEKMAALDVVHRRLEEKGLADFCLEVHSHKTAKLDIIKQLDKAWSTRGELSTNEWERKTTHLKNLRDRLNQVSEKLHEHHSNGLSVYRAIGQTVRYHDEQTPRLTWPSNTNHTIAEYDAFRDTARKLSLNFDAVNTSPSDFSIIDHSEWSNKWQDTITACAEQVPSSLDNFLSDLKACEASTQIELGAITLEASEKLIELLDLILQAYGKDLNLAFDPAIIAKLKVIEDLASNLQQYKILEGKLSVKYAPEAARSIDPDAIQQAWKEAGDKFWVLGSLAQKKVRKQLAALAKSTDLPDPEKDIPNIKLMKGHLSKIDATASELTGLPGYAGLDTNIKKLTEISALAGALQKKLPQLATSPDTLTDLKAAVRKLTLDSNDLLAPDAHISMLTEKFRHSREAIDSDVSTFESLSSTSGLKATPLETIRGAADQISQNQSKLRAWCSWRKARQSAVHQNLTPLVKAIENGSISAAEIEETFETSYSKWFAADAIDSEPILREFVASEQMSNIEEFRELDDQVAELTAQYTRSKLSGRLPNKADVGKKDGYGILKHEVQKKRMHKPLRQLASEMGDAFSNLAPCMLMSPLSIAQYLPADQQQFDLVIFDEASQISPWDAVGSIARGKQVVIAGDPRQMPPTNFFQRGAAAAEFDSDTDSDLESILDECLAVGVPRQSLNWHYRSRHESLIAFSNYKYYNSNLITFPAAVTKESAVSLVRVDGIYAKGAGQTNQVEAKAIVAETVKRLTDPQFVQSGKTLAIITLNSHQQALIEDLLDTARRENPEIEPFFSEELSEPVVVKNLETVQGDERDVIFLGIGYGPTEPGMTRMSMNFGPLNRDGGERRLNVALTRSKQEMVIFSSFDPSMIDLNRTSARAVRDLKHFLEFAERGPRALAEAVHGSVGGYDSPFEEAVAQRLQEKGWQVVPQVGVSKFRIDIGIVHPDRPGDFLAGVECDGATYHSGATARDRDKVRAAVLGDLGWDLVRVWSTNWFTDKEGEVEKLDAALRELYEASKENQQTPIVDASETEAPALEVLPNPAVLESPSNEQDIDIAETPLPLQEVAAQVTAVDTPSEETPSELARAIKTLTPPSEVNQENYVCTDFSSFKERINPELFYEDTYSGTLIELIKHTVETEAPIEDNLLIQRIARAHNFKRSGRRIREKLVALIDQHFHMLPDPAGGNFIWNSNEQSTHYSSYRTAQDSSVMRSIEEIPYQELLAAHRDGNSTPHDIARVFGIKRLTANVKERIEGVIALSTSSN